jgi:hypothetical protein
LTHRGGHEPIDPDICLRLKAGENDNQWDRLAEKGVADLTNQYPETYWEEQMKQAQRILVQETNGDKHQAVVPRGNQFPHCHE